MTVATSTMEVVYTGDSVTLEFPFTFTVITDADLIVEKRVASTDVVSTTYVLDTDYTVDTEYPDAGGSVTLLVAAPSSTYEIVIRREVEYTQEVDIINQGGFFPAVIQQQLDKQVMMIQQLDARTNEEGALIAASNLSDLADAEVARSNLGVFPGLDATAAAIDPYATFYLNASTGSDADDGATLANAWATFDYAISQIAAMRWPKWAGYIALQISDGAYTSDMASDYNGFPLFLGIDGIQILGNNGDATAVTLDVGSLMYVTTGVNVYFNAVTVENMNQCFCSYGAVMFSNCRFTSIDGTTSSSLFYASERGRIRITGSTLLAFTAATTRQALFRATDGGEINTADTITITGSPTVSTATAYVANNGYANFYNGGATTFSGTITGPRFSITQCSKVFTNGGGANYIGGDAAGSIDITSTYDAHMLAKSYTVAGMPSAANYGAGAMIYVSNEAGGAVLAFSDATNWRRVTDRAIVS